MGMPKLNSALLCRSLSNVSFNSLTSNLSSFAHDVRGHRASPFAVIKRSIYKSQGDYFHSYSSTATAIISAPRARYDVHMRIIIVLCTGRTKSSADRFMLALCYARSWHTRTDTLSVVDQIELNCQRCVPPSLPLCRRHASPAACIQIACAQKSHSRCGREKSPRGRAAEPRVDSLGAVPQKRLTVCART